MGSASRGLGRPPGVPTGGADPPPRDTWDTVNKWAVRILLERILVLFKFCSICYEHTYVNMQILQLEPYFSRFSEIYTT